MLANEAAWVERALGRLQVERLDPLLSIGSGTTHAREVLQPWIAEHVYAPLERRGVSVIHHEYGPGDGVDVTGDLLDPAVGERLRELGARSVLCCNVLEHLERREPVTRLLESLVAPGGYLVATVPRRFPYHPDPIDTMFRPSVDELSAELAGFTLVEGEEVDCGTLLAYLRRSGSIGRSIRNGLKAAARLGSRSATGPAPRPAEAPARPAGGALRYFVSSTAVTCAVLERPPGAA